MAASRWSHTCQQRASARRRRDGDVAIADCDTHQCVHSTQLNRARRQCVHNDSLSSYNSTPRHLGELPLQHGRESSAVAAFTSTGLFATIATVVICHVIYLSITVVRCRQHISLFYGTRWRWQPAIANGRYCHVMHKLLYPSIRVRTALLYRLGLVLVLVCVYCSASADLCDRGLAALCDSGPESKMNNRSAHWTT